MHREKSCHLDESDPTKLQLLWASTNSSDWEKSTRVPSIDGVRYTNLVARYDQDDSTRNFCGKGDTQQQDISTAQAQACFDLLKISCEKFRERVCPCFSLGDLVLANGRIREGDMILNQDKTCSAADAGEFYGLWMGATFAVHDDKQSCLDGTDLVITTSYDQGFHCFGMMSYTCSGLSLSRTENLKCKDDTDFRFKKHRNKNCAWVGNDKNGRCGKNVGSTGQRVFQFCKATCGYCKCQDDSNFYFNGQEDKGCAWVAAESTTESTAERCASLEGVSDHCLATCAGAECCEDNPEFEYHGFLADVSGQDCTWAGKNMKKKLKRCGRKGVAKNCPATCGLCPE